jgi:hypothetical protein
MKSMTHRDFLVRLVGALGAALLLAAALRLGFGALWFSFYGWATVALATFPYITFVFWKRLPGAGRSRWWSLAIGLPLALAAIVQIVFWMLFFSAGGGNPTFGIVREMVRPWLEAAEPFGLAAFFALTVWLSVVAGRHATPDG